MSTICVIGAGRVGLVTAVSFADLGHQVTIVDTDQAKVRALKRNMLPLHEPGLDMYWERNRVAGRIDVTVDYGKALPGAEFAVIAVGTPAARNGKPSLKWLRQAARSIAAHAASPLTVVIKSTVPLGTAAMVSGILSTQTSRNKKATGFQVVSNPEFMRKGTAIDDFLHPPRIVIGAEDHRIARAVAGLYEPMHSHVITCDTITAELSKYAASAFLTTRLSLMNELALISDGFGADITKVAEVIGTDPAYGGEYLKPGLGWSGSAVANDLRGLIHSSGKNGIPSLIINAVHKVNQRQPRIIMKKLTEVLGILEQKTVGILGLAYKPYTDEIQNAPSISIITLLRKAGCYVKAYDPVAMPSMSRLMPDLLLCHDAYDLAAGCDAVILATGWDEFSNLDMERLASVMKTNVFIDGRNFYQPEDLKRAGFICRSMGCSPRLEGPVLEPGGA